MQVEILDIKCVCMRERYFLGILETCQRITKSQLKAHQIHTNAFLTFLYHYKEYLKTQCK
jgi:hypothetical protein